MVIARNDILDDGPVDQPLTRAYEDPSRAPVRWAAIVVGLFFLGIGFAGFVPGVTLNFNQIEMGYGSEAMVLGIFRVSVLLNVVHLLIGAACIAQSRFDYSSRRILRIIGGISVLLWIFGLLVDPTSYSNFLPMSPAENWAYLVMAIVLIGLSFLSGEVTRTRASTDDHL